jgi:hypothetical protein
MTTNNSLNNSSANTLLTVTNTNSGGDANLYIKNTVDVHASQAYLKHTVTNTGGGDAYTIFTDGTSTWCKGIDNSNADTFCISHSSTPGTTDVFRADTNGNFTFPLQPSFGARVTSSHATVTGDGTQVTVQYDNEIWDQNSDYDDTTFTYTAPITGPHIFNVINPLLGSASTDEQSLKLITSNRTVTQTSGASLDTSNNFVPYIALILDMDSGDTAYVDMAADGGAASSMGYDAQGNFSGWYIG